MLSKLFVLRTFKSKQPHMLIKGAYHQSFNGGNNNQHKGGVHQTALRTFSSAGENEGETPVVAAGATDVTDVPQGEDALVIDDDELTDDEDEEVEVEVPRGPRFKNELMRDIGRWEEEQEDEMECKEDLEFSADEAEDEGSQVQPFTWRKYDREVEKRRSFEADTLKKLKMFDRSDELIGMIKSKLSKSGDNKKQLEGRLLTKLASSGKVYDSHIASAVQDKRKKHGRESDDLGTELSDAEAEEKRKLKVANAKKYNPNTAKDDLVNDYIFSNNKKKTKLQQKVTDSATMGHKDIGRHAYVPNNEMDMLRRHRRKRVVTAEEYKDLQQEETMVKFYKEIFNQDYSDETSEDSDSEEFIEPETSDLEDMGMNMEEYLMRHRNNTLSNNDQKVIASYDFQGNLIEKKRANVIDKDGIPEGVEQSEDGEHLVHEIEYIQADTDEASEEEFDMEEVTQELYAGDPSMPDDEDLLADSLMEVVYNSFEYSHSDPIKPLNVLGNYVTEDVPKDFAYERMEEAKTSRVYDNEAMVRTETNRHHILEGQDPFKAEQRLQLTEQETDENAEVDESLVEDMFEREARHKAAYKKDPSLEALTDHYRKETFDNKILSSSRSKDIGSLKKSEVLSDAAEEYDEAVDIAQIKADWKTRAKGRKEFEMSKRKENDLNARNSSDTEVEVEKIMGMVRDPTVTADEIRIQVSKRVDAISKYGETFKGEQINTDDQGSDGESDLFDEEEERMMLGAEYDDFENEESESEEENDSHDTEQEMMSDAQETFENLQGSSWMRYKLAQTNIQEYRPEVASKMKKARAALKQLKDRRDQVRDEIKKDYSRTVESQVTENERFHDFISHEKDARLKTQLKQRKDEIKYLLQQRRDFQFDPSSNDVSQYETELKLISKLGFLQRKTDKEQILKKFDFVFHAIEENRVKLTPELRARVFEYATLNGSHTLANTFLNKLTKDQTEHLSPVDTGYLELYYRRCLQDDNFDGIAYLVNYCQRYRVDVSAWELDKFRSALNYYVNDQFNMNKIMIFLKFYKHFYSCKANKELNRKLPSAETKEEKTFGHYKYIFGENEDLIDVSALTGFLVDKLGNKQLIDPTTKQDAVWSLIEFFTHSKKLQEVTALSANNKIEPQVIAKYLGNHLNMGASLDKIFKVALRLEGTKDSGAFAKEMLEQLKNYQSKNAGRLPASFSERKVSDLYIKLRDQNLSQDAAEVLLYVLKARGLNAEVIDFCSKNEEKNDLEKFYFSEALLSLPIKEGNSYVQALQDDRVLPTNNSAGLSSVELTQKVKAMFLDQGPDAAILFFNSELEKRQTKATARQDFLVSLYDSFFSKGEGYVTKDEFKQKYLQSSMVAAKTAKEAFAVNQLERVMENKNYDDVTNIFNLYTVMREEKVAVANMHVYDVDRKEVQKIQGTLPTLPFSETTRELTDRQQRILHLSQIQDRRKHLEQLVGQEDIARLNDITKVMDDEKISVMGQTQSAQVKHMSKMFQGMTVLDTEEVATRSKKLQEAVLGGTRDHHSDILHDYELSVKTIFTSMLEANMDAVENTDGQMLTRAWDDESEEIASKQIQLEKGFLEEYSGEESDREMLLNYRKHMLTDPYDDEGDIMHDPEFMMQTIRDSTMMKLKTQLLDAYNERKAGFALPITIEIFNRLTETSLKMKKLQLSDSTDDIEETIDTLDTLLNDSRSPIVSTLKNSAQFTDFPIQERFEQWFKSTDEARDNRIDFQHAERECAKLGQIEVQLKRALKKIKLQQDKLNEEVHEEPLSQIYSSYQKSNKQELSNEFNKRIDILYREFTANQRQSVKLSREQKLHLMRDTLAIEMGENFASHTESTLPSFYALDLMRFGLDKEIPDAIRLGEKLISEARQQGSNVSMPRDLAVAVKNFMVSAKNQKGYREAVKRTGPIDNTSIYHQTASSSSDSTSGFYCLDDPYWQNFMAKNRRREDQWKQPSPLSWDHKQYGILGEIFDMNRIRENYEKTISKFQ